MTRLISSIYTRGDESSAHYIRGKGDRSSNWANVPKNKRPPVGSKIRNINVAQHEYEMKHGYASIPNLLETMAKAASIK
jgi:hypothetical protein